ncbi:hypothetical protein [Methylobacterium sp. Leaf106]|uniref:hypothetical protein n=1 Tax=Methylobacterium sp. Leaf106 TaxID=1736255 RepID=UPI0006FB0911|nr:hypothetical protein [Methylobacterium sp. Leaf106]KQP53076.1 hypothetical protein ASF34_01525 [Methylobacterium sp. Leaf106]
MPTAETLRALLALVEEAKAGSRELDEAIHGALLPDDPWWQAIVEGRRLVAAGQEDTKIDACNCNLRADSWATGSRVHAYTTSIDAALALVAKVLPDTVRPALVQLPWGHWRCSLRCVELGEWPASYYDAVTLPLAILAALLRALLQQSETAHVER